MEKKARKGKITSRRTLKKSDKEREVGFI